MTEDLKTQTITVNFGPQHPATHGVLYLRAEIDGEVVVDSEPVIGYLHRSIEKIAENRTYNQVLPLLDRCDYISAYANELGYVICVEQLLGVKPTERAEYIRVILTEMNRILSHIFFYATYALDIGAVTPFLYAFREREKIFDIFEAISGYRMTPNYFRFGGVKEDLPDGALERIIELIDAMPQFVKDYDELLSGNEIFMARTQGLNMMPPGDLVNWGITGPVARSCGVKRDLRKDAPYSIYEKFDFDVISNTHGDVFDAFRIRLIEIGESCKIIRQAVSGIPSGKINLKLPMRVKPPKGEAYSRVESPRGELGYYIVSDGTDKPYRMKMRPPSFTNLMALPPIIKGWKVPDMVAMMGVLDIVLGEIDR